MVHVSRKSPFARLLFFLSLIFLFANSAMAHSGSESFAEDGGWKLTSSFFVFLMMLPGLALFYGGFVQRANLMSVWMRCLALSCILSLVWLVLGYALAIGQENGAFVGSGHVFHLGIGKEKMLESIFQMGVFLITPALILGSCVERMKFSAVLVFLVIWSLAVYAPICHMTWFGGWLDAAGVVDLGGGIVVHLTAGVAALITCIMVGKRLKPLPPHHFPMMIAGATILWIGWLAISAGRQAQSVDAAAMTVFVTYLAAASAALTWALLDGFTNQKPCVLAISMGAMAGFAAISPAAGVAGPVGALLIGSMAGVGCWWASVRLKKALGYDDSLDVVGVHAVGGLIGTLMVALVGLDALGGTGSKGFGEQLGLQFTGAGFAIAYTAVVTIVILFFTRVICGGLRVTASEEENGLELSETEEIR